MAEMFKKIKTDKLVQWLTRPINETLIQELTEEYKKHGYSKFSALLVAQTGDNYKVIGGNHRLGMAQAEGIEELPCMVTDELEVSWYTMAIEHNRINKTLRQDDLFDWLFRVKALKAEGLAQVEIGKRVGWSREKVRDHSLLIEKIGAQILILAEQHQKGRAPQDGAIAPFDFTEGWFRNSGMYKLCPKYQKVLFNGFMADNFKWKTNKVKAESAKYKLWQEFLEVAKEELVSEEDYGKIEKLIEANIFKNTKQLRDKIKAFNDKAKNKLICGDCLVALDEIEDPCINLVITDPPYGVDYSSNRSQFEEHVTREKIANDENLPTALELFNDVCKKLDEKTMADAHFYFFTSWKVYPDFVEIVSKYFKVKNMIVWDKGNHGSGDLNGAWGNKHELIIFATKGNRPVNKRLGDIIAVPKVSSKKAIHPTQKPCDLIKKLLEVSAVEADVVCDPFMGSGSTIKAIKEHGDLSYIGIELDRGVFDKAKAFVGK